MTVSLVLVVGAGLLQARGLWLLADAVAAGLLGVVVLWRRMRRCRAEAAWERARREELEAYCRLQVTLAPEAQQRKVAEQAKRVCRTIVQASVFQRAALLLRDDFGGLVVVGSSGMNDLTLDGLNEHAETLLQAEGDGAARLEKSFSVQLGGAEIEGGMPGCGSHRVLLVPVRMHRGRLVGVVAVCATEEVEQLAREEGQLVEGEWVMSAVSPLELLAAKLARLIERNLLMERLIEVERIAGVGQLVAGVAEELAEPLAATLGLAELIAQTASDARVRSDATDLAAYAGRMGETVERLRGFWRPEAPEAEGVRSDLAGEEGGSVPDRA